MAACSGRGLYGDTTFLDTVPLSIDDFLFIWGCPLVTIVGRGSGPITLTRLDLSIQYESKNPIKIYLNPTWILRLDELVSRDRLFCLGVVF